MSSPTHTRTAIHPGMKRIAIATLLAGLALTACSSGQEVSFPDPVLDQESGEITPGVETLVETPSPEPTAADSIEVEMPEVPAAGAPGGKDPRIGQKGAGAGEIAVPAEQDNAAVKRGWEAANPRVPDAELEQTSGLEPGAVPPPGWQITPTGDGSGYLMATQPTAVGPGAQLTVPVGQLLTWSDDGIYSVGAYLLTGDAITGGTGYYDDYSQTFDADTWGPLHILAIRPGRGVIQVNGQTAVIDVVDPQPWDGR